MASQEIGCMPDPELTPTHDGISISLTTPDQTYEATIDLGVWRELKIEDRILMTVGSYEEGVSVREEGAGKKLRQKICFDEEEESAMKQKMQNCINLDETIGRETDEDTFMATRIYLTEKGQERVLELLEELN